MHEGRPGGMPCAGMNDYLSSRFREAELKAALQRCRPAALSAPPETSRSSRYIGPAA